MTDDAPAPEFDRVQGAPHPRDTQVLVGQSQAETTFLSAFNTARLHHGWLITGPRGIGKATLAWRIARFLLANPPGGDGSMFGDDLPAWTSHPITRSTGASPRCRNPACICCARSGTPTRNALKTASPWMRCAN